MTSPVDDVRVAVIGYGPAGEVFHAPLLATTPGIRLAAIVTSDPERSRRASLAYPGVPIVAGATEFWEHSGGLDLVVIATPNRTHGQTISRYSKSEVPPGFEPGRRYTGAMPKKPRIEFPFFGEHVA